MNGASIWRAMAGNPGRFLLSSWPWRSLAYLLSTIVVAATVWVAVLPVLLFPPALVLTGLPVGALERRRLILLRRAPAGTSRAAPPPGAIAWVRCRLGEGATWREFAYAMCLMSGLVVADLIGIFVLLVCLLFAALPLLLSVGSLSVHLRLGSWVIDSMGSAWIASAGVGLPATIIATYALCVLAGAQGSFARWLLTPAEELDRRVQELTESRTRLVSAFEAERRRIERDLHDGAQQHLVLLSMNLGLAELELAGGNQRARDLVGEAHQQARQALDDRLLLEVTDDRCGGADEAGGSGLRGLADRAAVMDGTVQVTSPAGGPTTLRLELPCRCG